MEPVKGGMLATPPKGVEEILRAAEPQSSCASWALRFAANLEGVIAVLSGMSSVEQMRDNIAQMRDFAGLSAAQKETIERARQELARVPLIPCTSCNYCAKVCPAQIGISGSLTAMNSLTLYGNRAAAVGQENWLVGRHGRQSADKCQQCGACEKVCPQHLPIRKYLKQACQALLND